MPSGELRDMDRLPTRIDRNSEDFNRRRDFNIQLVDELKQKINQVKEGGGKKYVDRHRSRGKLLARERINEICDSGTPFLEFSSLAANGLYDSRAHSAGIITGIGVVHGKECLFVANDATVKGGSLSYDR